MAPDPMALCRPESVRRQAPWPRTARNVSPRSGTATTPATIVPATSAAMLTAQSDSPYR